MPRPKVDPRHRRRAANACDSCKKRKAKCNGILPCDQCIVRRVENDCNYSRNPRPQSRHNKEANETPDGEPQLEGAVLGDRPSTSPSRQVDVPVANLSPSSKDLQMRKVGQGKFIYVGESASLSFLETVRIAVQNAVGPCPFTNEPARNPMIESSPKIQFEMAQEPSLDPATVQTVVSHFFLAVSGTLDLFDPPWLMSQIQQRAESRLQRSRSESAVTYLALAIGFQGRAQGRLDELHAEQCFAYGRHLTMHYLMDDPSLAIIQAVLLITYYMIAACQYNAAFVNLGVASRAAYTLGIHLHETNTAFGGEEGLSRERAWKSLRVCDLFLAASLGRPPATSEAVSNITWAPMKPLRECDRPGAAGQVFSAMFRICNIFERILIEVYTHKAVSLEKANSISRQHRQWTEELPRMLMVDGLEESDAGQGSGTSPKSFGLSAQHGSSIVTMAYYYSIVLLTRPFLTFQVGHGLEKKYEKVDNSSKASIATYADACVNSASKGIDIAYEYVFELNTPRRQPLVVNSVFVSALCLGLACLNASGRQQWPVEASLNQATKILARLGELNAQSARYAGICIQLKDAANIYVSRRDDTLLEENDRKIRSIFGDLRASSRPRTHNEGSVNDTESPRRPGWIVPLDGSRDGLVTPPPFDFNTLQEESMLPTSGIPPGLSNMTHNFEQYNSLIGDGPHPRPADHGVEPNSRYLVDSDIPLFPLANDSSPESYFNHASLSYTALGEPINAEEAAGLGCID